MQSSAATQVSVSSLPANIINAATVVNMPISKMIGWITGINAETRYD